MYEEFFSDDFEERKRVITILLINNLFHHFDRPEKTKHFCITIDEYNYLTFTLYDDFSATANALVIGDRRIRLLCDETKNCFGKDKLINAYALFDEYVNILAEKK